MRNNKQQLSHSYRSVLLKPMGTGCSIAIIIPDSIRYNIYAHNVCMPFRVVRFLKKNFLFFMCLNMFIFQFFKHASRRG